MRSFGCAVLLLAIVWAMPAQSQSRPCLSEAEVKTLLQERGGQTWDYAPAERAVVQGAACVNRSGSDLRYMPRDGQQRGLLWVGMAQHGHWYRIRRIGTGFERYQDRSEAKMPPNTAIYAAIATSESETLMVVRFMPPLQRVSVPWTIEYQARVKLSTDPSLPMVWPASSTGVDYRPAPKRGAGGIEALYGYNDAQMSAAEAETFHKRYSPAVLDFMEGRFFDEALPVSLSQVSLPGIGPVGIRAGAIGLPPQSGQRPPEEILSSLPTGVPLYLFLHVMIGRPIERDTSSVHHIQIAEGTKQAYSFTSNPEDFKAGWTEYWLTHPVPVGRLAAGHYAIEWRLGASLAAKFPVTVYSR